MPFPSTPFTLLGRLKHREMPRLWETSWEEFFDLYHNAVSVCVLGAFKCHDWHDVPPPDLQDVVLAVFESLSLEAFQLSPEHREAKEILKARLAKAEPERKEAECDEK
jgi:hypothetical protein